MKTTNILNQPQGAQLALWAGIAFSAIITFLIWLADPLLARFELAPNGEIIFYEWQLLEPNLTAQIILWVMYALHQVTFWALIYYAQTRVQKYSTGVHPINLCALGINAFFILLHFLQTHIWYDAIAQDLPSWTSQGSVILMLCAILLIENQRRGVFFGAKVPFSKRVGAFARKYHGYLFAWATVFTFWFHPMVSSPGHLAGFLYMFFLLLQGSLFLTRVHVNKWWMVTQEVMVLIHGTLVAVFQGANLWPMFAFGFAAMFVITQMHGLGLSRLVRWAIGMVYILAVVVVYSSRELAALNELIRIPVIEYLVMFMMAGLVWLGLWIADRIKSLRPAPSPMPVTVEQRGQGDD